MVLAYSEACRVLADEFAPLDVYGAFSGKLQVGEKLLDEKNYNMIEGGEPHKKLGYVLVFPLIIFIENFQSGKLNQVDRYEQVGGRTRTQDFVGRRC